MKKRNRSRSGSHTTCPVCGRQLRGLKGLKMHMEFAHPGRALEGGLVASSHGIVGERGPEANIGAREGGES